MTRYECDSLLGLYHIHSGIVKQNSNIETNPCDTLQLENCVKVSELRECTSGPKDA